MPWSNTFFAGQLHALTATPRCNGSMNTLIEIFGGWRRYPIKHSKRVSNLQKGTRQSWEFGPSIVCM